MVAPRSDSRGRRWPVRGVAVGLLAAGVLVVSCSSDDSAEPAPGPAPSTSRSPAPQMTVSPTPTSPADGAGQRAVAAYVGLWEAMAEASHTSDWQSPELARYASGDALQAVSGGLYADHYNGLVSRGAPVLHPEVTSVEPADAPTTVRVFDCSDSTNWLRHRADGAPFTDEPGGRRAVTSEVRLHQDGSWKVTRFAVEPVGSCS